LQNAVRGIPSSASAYYWAFFFASFFAFLAALAASLFMHALFFFSFLILSQAETIFFSPAAKDAGEFNVKEPTPTNAVRIESAISLFIFCISIQEVTVDLGWLQPKLNLESRHNQENITLSDSNFRQPVCGGDKLDHGSGGFSCRGRIKTLPPVAFDPFGDGRREDVHRGSLLASSACLSWAPRTMPFSPKIRSTLT
jgi:hypothetical protein